MITVILSCRFCSAIGTVMLLCVGDTLPNSAEIAGEIAHLKAQGWTFKPCVTEEGKEPHPEGIAMCPECFAFDMLSRVLVTHDAYGRHNAYQN